MARILAVDYGTKRTGLAVTDPLQIIASALETVPTHTLMAYIEKYQSENPLEGIVVGMPRQMNGEPSESFKHIEPFVKKLRAKYPLLNIEYHDERFTSVLAQRAIIEAGIKKMKRQDKSLVDKVSATIILQSYLETKNNIL
ncbi:MAG: Holliday junction resolvase RuvX [Rikenellaceae bacterium]